MRQVYFLCAMISVFGVGAAFSEEVQNNKIVAPGDMGDEFRKSPPQCYPVTEKNWGPESNSGDFFFGTTAGCSKLFGATGKEYVPVAAGILFEPGGNDRVFSPTGWKTMPPHPVVSGVGPHDTEGFKCAIYTEGPHNNVGDPKKGPRTSQFTCIVNCCQVPEETSRLDYPGSKYVDFQSFTVSDYKQGIWALVSATTNNGKFDESFVPRLKLAAADLCYLASKGEPVEYEFDVFWSEKIGHFHIGKNGWLYGHAGDRGDDKIGGRFANVPAGISPDKVLCIAQGS